jgi:hypothetical protein
VFINLSIGAPAGVDRRLSRTTNQNLLVEADDFSEAD